MLVDHLLQKKVQVSGGMGKNLRLRGQAKIRIFCVGVKRKDAYQRKNT
jgi:hypothetical protein